MECLKCGQLFAMTAGGNRQNSTLIICSKCDNEMILELRPVKLPEITRMSDQWIKVGERLPEDNMRVLVAVCGGTCIATHSYTQQYWREGPCTVHGVTHWQPLPPLPAPEDSELVKKLKALANDEDNAIVAGDWQQTISGQVLAKVIDIVREHERSAGK